MSTGYFVGGKELTATEAKALRLPVKASPNPLPRLNVPTYSYNGRLFTRAELETLFRMDWKGATAGDVESFIKSHFWDKSTSHLGFCKPTDTIPYGQPPHIPEDMDDREVTQILTQWAHQRSNSRRARQLFCIDGLPKFVPSNGWPDGNDTPEQAKRKADYINAL